MATGSPRRTCRLFPRKCLRCSIEYQPTGTNQKYCPKCHPVVLTEQIQSWVATHVERQRELCRRWASEHPDAVKEASSRSYEMHKKEVCEKSRLWKLAHPDKVHAAQKISNARYYANNREKCLAQVKKYSMSHPDKVAAHHSKRRALGHTPMNLFFLGSEAHHVDRNNIVYIPKTLHRSTYHNIWTGKGMGAINKLAYAFLTEDWT